MIYHAFFASRDIIHHQDDICQATGPGCCVLLMGSGLINWFVGGIWVDNGNKDGGNGSASFRASLATN